MLLGFLIESVTRSSTIVQIAIVDPGDDLQARMAALELRLRQDQTISVSPAETGPAESTAVNPCGVQATHVRLAIGATRRSFSRAFRRLPLYAQESGLQICGLAYYRADNPSTSANRIAALGAAPMAMILAGLLAWWGVKRGGRPWGRSRLSVPEAIRTGLVAGAMLAVGMSLLAQIAHLLGFSLPTQPVLGADGLAATALLGLNAVALAPLVEEFAFRAWFLSQAAPAVGMIVAAVAASLAFSAVHVPDVPVQALGFFLFSLAMSFLWARSGSLLACVVAHGFHNALVGLARLAAAEG